MMILSLYLYQGVLKSADEIIEDNKNITETAVKKLTLQANQDLLPVWENYLEGKNKITKQEERLADSLLSKSVESVLSNFYRLEGGFYFYNLDEFIGYSFPTIEEPKPAFGPPPRSYNIIREQARATITRDSLLTHVHRFDPAVFPLSTQPLYVNEELVGAVWARIHIERKLETSQNIQSGTFFLTLGAILFGLFVTVLAVWTLRKRMREIKDGLHRMKHDASYRLKEYNGAFGVISKAINDMTDTRQQEQEKRKMLQAELYQKEKMATLGNLIAGTAHEINTPISIIKTRLQIWERTLQKPELGWSQKSQATEKSLNIIHTEIDRVSALIKRLLLFSKPTNNKKSSLDIHSVLQETIEWIHEAFPGHSIDFSTSFDSEMPHIEADKKAMEHLFTNILKNAVEASPENCQIVLSTTYKAKQQKAEIRIRDFGITMNDDIKHKIFDPFFSTKNNGTGLGLSICNEIIKAHNGSIRFERPSRHSAPLQQWDQNTNMEHESSVAGTVCIITLPIS